ncbi:Na+/H+ antiporter subunit E [Marinospirillum alkaliphilum]|uniref:Multicomponent Na+:H+ antiporter subunit E n=1 Tax=Marinospirillum alkaliphilum DSM 21637 TaxID=1122209 RepID=A0A1K1YEQ6_9GAMM|nr:Na+/H+ antiporter subunit E [Marinospirillum alkaliphilum]SFX59995.1 multicomponent Na+:H+ antiporter subunit E [Marinospirillum alkaliphilum DSM 21637]
MLPKPLMDVRMNVSGIISLLLRLVLAATVWWLISEGRNDSWVLGAPAVLLAVWLSHHLHPQPGRRLSLVGLLAFWWFFTRQSLLAGLDVARRTLSPELPIQPGAISVPLYLPSGAPRWLLAMTLSLLPGTLSVRFEKDRLLLHCLDMTQPVEHDVFVAQRQIAAVFGLPVADLLEQEQRHRRQET